MSACHEGHEWSADFNAVQTGSVHHHGEVYDGGLILFMGVN